MGNACPRRFSIHICVDLGDGIETEGRAAAGTTPSTTEAGLPHHTQPPPHHAHGVSPRHGAKAVDGIPQVCPLCTDDLRVYSVVKCPTPDALGVYYGESATGATTHSVWSEALRRLPAHTYPAPGTRIVRCRSLGEAVQTWHRDFNDGKVPTQNPVLRRWRCPTCHSPRVL